MKNRGGLDCKIWPIWLSRCGTIWQPLFLNAVHKNPAACWSASRSSIPRETMLHFCDTWMIVVTASLGLVLLLHWWLTKSYGKFEAKGVFSVQPLPVFGNLYELYSGQKNFATAYNDLYQAFEGHAYAVVYDCREAIFYFRDPDLIKRVAIRDFDHFMNSGFISEELSKMEINNFGLLSAAGEDWRSLKASITPAFSVKYLKRIVEHINLVAESVIDYINGVNDGPTLATVNVDELVNGFSIDCITRSCFSVEIGAVKNPDNEFSRNGKDLFQVWRLMLTSILPVWVVKTFNVAVLNPSACQYFLGVARDLMKKRRREDKEKEDFLGLFLRSQHLKRNEKDDVESGVRGAKTKPLSDSMIASTLMQFFMDGFETVASNVALGFYYLAVNEDIQAKARREVDAFKPDNEHSLTVEDTHQLKYLDQIVQETMRLAAIPMTFRICTKDWTVPGTDLVIHKGQKVMWPILAIHKDPNYYQDPEKFKPDRFSPQNRSSIRPETYMPFGIGPRQCLGIRIARLEAKILFYHVLKNFIIEPSAKTPIPIALENDEYNRIKGGSFLKFKPRK